MPQGKPTCQHQPSAKKENIFSGGTGHDKKPPNEPFKLKIYLQFHWLYSRLVAIRHMDFRIAMVVDSETGTKPELEYTFQRGDVIDLGVEFENPRKNFGSV